MIPIIRTEEENSVALTFVERLIDADCGKDSKESKFLELLVEAIQLFEKRYDTLLTPTDDITPKE